MTTWIEQGQHNLLPDDTLTAIEQEGFGIVCAVLDIEGESVYRILNAVNAHHELLAAYKAVAAALEREQADGWLLWLSDPEAVHETASERLASVIAKTEGRT